MTLNYIADALNFSIAGDKNFDVANISYADEAAENDLAVAFSLKDIERTKANTVLTEPRIVAAKKIFVFCSYGEIISALADVANFFVREGLRKNYNIPPRYEKFFDGVMCGKNFEVGAGTVIEPFVTIGDDVKIGDNCFIESNVSIGSGTVIENNCVIHSGARIGAKSFLHYEKCGVAKCFFGIGQAILGDGVQVGYNSIIQRGTISDTLIGERTLIGNLVVIAHDVKIDSDSRVVCQSGIAGGAKVGSHVKILAQSGVVDNVELEDYVTLLSKSVATKNVKRGKTISGLYGREHKAELKTQASLRKLKWK